MGAMLSDLGGGDGDGPAYGWLRVLLRGEDEAPADEREVVSVPYVLRAACVCVGSSAECAVRVGTGDRVLLRVEHDAATRQTRVVAAARDVAVLVRPPAKRGAGAQRPRPLHATVKHAVVLEYGAVLAVTDETAGARYRLRYDAPLADRAPAPETAAALDAALRAAAATPVQCRAEQMPIIPGDCVRHVRDPTLIGVVEDVPEDADAGAWGVPAAAPDDGMLVVTWLDAREAPSWEYPDDLVLLGRYWHVGDMCGVPGVVAGDAMIVLMRRGVVTAVATAYDLQAERDHTRFWLGVPARATRLLSTLAPGTRVADRATGAVGTVADVRYDLVVALDAGATVVLRRAALDDDIEPLVPDADDTGAAARAARERAGPAPSVLTPVWPGLRVAVADARLAAATTEWRAGAFAPGMATHGTVLHVRAAAALVDWVAMPTPNSNSGEGHGNGGDGDEGAAGAAGALPPEEIDADRLVAIAPDHLIDIGNRVLFDAAAHPECPAVRIPIRRTRDGHRGSSTSSTTEEPEEHPAVPEGTEDDRDETAVIVRYRCVVTVMWCDGTTEELAGNDIITDELFAEEEHFFCRGDFVERADGSQPGTIGFVDTCDLREKMVAVRWRPLGTRPGVLSSPFTYGLYFF